MDDFRLSAPVVLCRAFFVDWQQTREFTGDRCKYPDKYETNPLLRDHPSAREVNLAVAGSLIVHSAVAYLLPKPYRIFLQRCG